MYTKNMIFKINLKNLGNSFMIGDVVPGVVVWSLCALVRVGGVRSHMD